MQAIKDALSCVEGQKEVKTWGKQDSYTSKYNQGLQLVAQMHTWAFFQYG